LGIAIYLSTRRNSMRTVCTTFVHAKEISVNAFVPFLHRMLLNARVRERLSSGVIAFQNAVNNVV
jgi:hypothetical protein